jgi:hypothetical protein
MVLNSTGGMWYGTEPYERGRTSRRQTSEELGERVDGNDCAVELSDCFVGSCYIEQRDCSCHHYRADVERLRNGIIDWECTCTFTDQN